MARPEPDAAPPRRVLQRGQRSQLWVTDATTGAGELVLESDELLFEAPNWTMAADRLVVNGDGRLWSVDLRDPTLQPIRLDGVPDLNNDHVLAPDGEHIYLSAADGQIYRAPLAGGTAARVSDPATVPGLMHFLHGVSPDGARLAFVGLETPSSGARPRANVVTMTVEGADYRFLTDSDHPADGCEYAADGTWICYNTEVFTGHAQLARIPVDGGPEQRLRSSPTVDWFPHLSPDGKRASFIAFPSGTEGHPPDLWVDIMLVTDTTDWQTARSVAHVVGGQGSLNVNSWSPDSTHFAYVAYPVLSR